MKKVKITKDTPHNNRIHGPSHGQTVSTGHKKYSDPILRQLNAKNNIDSTFKARVGWRWNPSGDDSVSADVNLILKMVMEGLVLCREGQGRIAW